MTPQKPAAVPESSGRKPWIKKTTVEVVLEQIAKQEQRVAELREALTHEERELEQLQEARTVLERK
jgi:cell division protein FtsB